MHGGALGDGVCWDVGAPLTKHFSTKALNTTLGEMLPPKVGHFPSHNQQKPDLGVPSAYNKYDNI